MLRLRVTPASGPAFTRSVEGSSLVIGRARDADLTLQDRFLSRRHARLYRDGDRLLIEDLGSQNGTLVNDSAVEEPVELRPGDVVRLSASSLTLEDASVETRPPSSHTALLRPVREILESREAPPPAAKADAETLRRYAERLRLVNEVHKALARSLGLLPGARRDGAELRLEPGDLLVLYTDGVTEAMDPDGEEYGEERLAELGRRLRDRPLPELARELEEDLGRFARGVPFHDDRTVVLARRLESGNRAARGDS